LHEISAISIVFNCINIKRYWFNFFFHGNSYICNHGNFMYVKYWSGIRKMIHEFIYKPQKYYKSTQFDDKNPFPKNSTMD